MLTIKVNREAQSQEYEFHKAVFKTWDTVLNTIERVTRHASDDSYWHGDDKNPWAAPMKLDGITIECGDEILEYDDVLGILSTAKRWAEWSLHCARMNHMQAAAIEQHRTQQAAQAIMGNPRGRPKLHL